MKNKFAKEKVTLTFALPKRKRAFRFGRNRRNERLKVGSNTTIDEKRFKAFGSQNVL